MKEEEKEAIRNLIDSSNLSLIGDGTIITSRETIGIILNLIETQKAEIEKKDKRISDLEFALMDMVLQFADEDKEQINTMGLSALEIAFTELDLYDPIDKKEVEKKYAELAAKYYGLAEEKK